MPSNLIPIPDMKDRGAKPTVQMEARLRAIYAAARYALADAQDAAKLVRGGPVAAVVHEVVMQMEATSRLAWSLHAKLSAALVADEEMKGA